MIATTADSAVREDVVHNLCTRIIETIEVTSIKLLDDYGDREQQVGHHLELQDCMVQADARLECRVKLPEIPRGYRLEVASKVVNGHVYSELILRGPDIDSDDPEIINSILSELYTEELVRKLQPAIREEIDERYLEDYDELAKGQTADVHSPRLFIDESGAFIGFKVEVEN